MPDALTDLVTSAELRKEGAKAEEADKRVQADHQTLAQWEDARRTELAKAEVTDPHVPPSLRELDELWVKSQETPEEAPINMELVSIQNEVTLLFQRVVSLEGYVAKIFTHLTEK